ncbi:uncharacterized protein N7483_004321 [Penicillium malachiteum]|uniref:uncharacterized protein n=1 Tax=Penicillium malachiteum TaxID=1324776 RepID=UPI002546B884|nr:uncharacterized protein N7483_004321 [Penicillium malachiteum]KAJ5729813.1 hypothetical protein N7483_004321 [Penicillium malachiteum]
MHKQELQFKIEAIKDFEWFRGWFIPKKWRDRKLMFYIMAAEFPFCVAILTLTGIASHNTYRTLLWQDGYENGFNSSPDQSLYAAANYQPYTAPLVWSSFLTNFNLVIGVLSVFLLIVKLPVHFMHLLWPPIAVFINGGCIVVYAFAARYQAGPDMSDPSHPQPGPPWYIAKSCTVAYSKSDIGYCRQAKSLFYLCVILILVYVIEFCVCLRSCWITYTERDEILEAREERRIETEFEEEIMKSPYYPTTPGPIPRTPGFPPMAAQVPGRGGPLPPGVGGVYPYTPRHLAFNRLDSQSSDLPLRHKNGEGSSSSSPQVSNPSPGGSQSQMYFPPPPKKATN